MTLSNQIRKCRQCPLHRKCKAPVPGVGMSGASIMVVGQATGWQEDRDGIPWIGQSGQFLSEILEFLGWRSQDIYYTNTVKCYPGRAKGGDAKPPPFAIEACSTWLQQEIELIKPRVIIAVGAEAMKAFGIKGGIQANSGKVFRVLHLGGSSYEMSVIPVLHPAGLFRRPTDTPNFITSLRIIRTFLEGFRAPPPFVEVGNVLR